MSPYVYVIIALTLSAAVFIGVTLARQGHPEESALHRASLDDLDSQRMLRSPGDRPGGPGQAGQHVVGPGEITPGPAEDRTHS